MLFSQRKGYKPASHIIQRDGITLELRNRLWNVLDLMVWETNEFLLDRGYGSESGMELFSKFLWNRYFKIPVDSRSGHSPTELGTIRKYFFSCEWYEIYDFLEFSLKYFDHDDLTQAINHVLEAELSAYRFVDNVFTDITNEQEIKMLEEALHDDDFPGVVGHLQRALELLSDRKNPDYRNSIKESISAVESLAMAITRNPKATLGDALNTIKRNTKIHPALLESFSKIYGYTSDEGGIRHAMLEEPDLSQTDAKFFLLSSTSFINYLKSKL